MASSIGIMPIVIVPAAVATSTRPRPRRRSKIDWVTRTTFALRINACSCRRADDATARGHLRSERPPVGANMTARRPPRRDDRHEREQRPPADHQRCQPRRATVAISACCAPSARSAAGCTRRSSSRSPTSGQPSDRSGGGELVVAATDQPDVTLADVRQVQVVQTDSPLQRVASARHHLDASDAGRRCSCETATPTSAAAWSNRCAAPGPSRRGRPARGSAATRTRRQRHTTIGTATSRGSSASTSGASVGHLIGDRFDHHLVERQQRHQQCEPGPR